MVILGCIVAAAVLAAPKEDVYAKWRDYIEPKPSECGFETVPWRGTFWSAVVDAQRDRKPILLWAMNGHPLACT